MAKRLGGKAGVGGRGMRTGAAACLVLTSSACGLLHRSDKPSPQAAAAAATEDSRIRGEVEARLAAEPSLHGGPVRVEVSAGEVRLYGTVVGFGALQCAETNAQLVRGVKLVIDYMDLQSGPRTVRCLAPRAMPAPPVSAPPAPSA
jgi:hypothetical protein